jgi:hypothetical protein
MSLLDKINELKQISNKTIIQEKIVELLNLINIDIDHDEQQILNNLNYNNLNNLIDWESSDRNIRNSLALHHSEKIILLKI